MFECIMIGLTGDSQLKIWELDENVSDISALTLTITIQANPNPGLRTQPRLLQIENVCYRF
jgi:hypothetical protein